MFKELWQKLVDKVKSLFGINKEEETPAENAAAPNSSAPVETAQAAPELQPEVAVAQTVAAYHELADPQSGIGGVIATDQYPAPFQATEFPLLAGEGGRGEILGNNQAFFFVKNPAGNQDPSQMQLDTTHLKTLIENIYDAKSEFTLAIDADVTQNPERFIQKYAHLRGEPDPATREALLSHETALIGGFIAAGGVHDLVREVIAEKNEAKGQRLPANALDALTDGFLRQNFRIEGVITEQALDGAIWNVEGPNGALLAKQLYEPSTDRDQRKWLIGTKPALIELAQSQTESSPAALSVLEAVLEAGDLPRQNLLQSVRGQAQTQSQQR